MSMTACMIGRLVRRKSRRSHSVAFISASNLTVHAAALALPRKRVLRWLQTSPSDLGHDYDGSRYSGPERARLRPGSSEPAGDLEGVVSPSNSVSPPTFARNVWMVCGRSSSPSWSEVPAILLGASRFGFPAATTRSRICSKLRRMGTSSFGEAGRGWWRAPSAKTARR